MLWKDKEAKKELTLAIKSIENAIKHLDGVRNLYCNRHPKSPQDMTPDEEYEFWISIPEQRDILAYKENIIKCKENLETILNK
jgi:hypothetical protein